jgi:hypothetical protein
VISKTLLKKIVDVTKLQGVICSKKTTESRKVIGYNILFGAWIWIGYNILKKGYVWPLYYGIVDGDMELISTRRVICSKKTTESRKVEGICYYGYFSYFCWGVHLFVIFFYWNNIGIFILPYK